MTTKKRRLNEEELAVKAMRSAVLDLVQKHFKRNKRGVRAFTKEFDDMLAQVNPPETDEGFHIHVSGQTAEELADQIMEAIERRKRLALSE